jgi:MFS family permease
LRGCLEGGPVKLTPFQQGCFILAAGKGADIYGRKTAFLVGESVMLISTMIAGFMRNEIAFYIFRATAGLAGALVTASNFGMYSSNAS